MRTTTLIAGLTCLATFAGVASPVIASVTTEQVAAEGQTERATMMLLLRPMTVELTDQRFEDVVEYISNVTGAEIDALWMDDANAIGLDPDQTINLRARNASALSVLERALEQSAVAFGEPGSATWQFTKYGSFEIGPKERLNKHRRVELYDINDLLFEIPDFDNAPTFDLNSVLQSSGGRGGGGGGRSPFQNTRQQNQGQDRIPREELADNIIDVITSLTETEQWEANGGDGGSIRFFQGHLLVNAPDYMHRGINGYRWWPKRLTQRASAPGNNAMTFTSDELRKQKDTLLIDPTQVQKPVRGDVVKPADD
jgi:hypothetical protein